METTQQQQQQEVAIESACVNQLRHNVKQHVSMAKKAVNDIVLHMWHRLNAAIANGKSTTLLVHDNCCSIAPSGCGGGLADPQCTMATVLAAFNAEFAGVAHARVIKHGGVELHVTHADVLKEMTDAGYP
jgi:hypothetical protein